MKLAYYPGCSAKYSAGIYDLSLKWVLAKLEIELTELPDWICCGATSAHALEKPAAFLLPAANLLRAQKLELDLLAPCSACYQRLKIAENEVLKGPQANSELKEALGEEFRGTIKILSLLEVLNHNLGKLTGLIRRDLAGAKAIPYYGCLLSRIPGVKGFDDQANPVFMDRLLEITGAEVLDFPRKTDCCGAAFGVCEERLYEKLSGEILDEARKAGGEYLVACCPFCQLNLEMLGWKRKKQDKTYQPLPVLFITQWLGLALGGNPKELGIKSLLIEPGNLTALSSGR